MPGLARRPASALEEDLRSRFPGFRPDPAWAEVVRRYPASAPAYYLDLIREPSPDDPVFRQVAPAAEELVDGGGEDPIGEAEYEAAPGLLHRFPDRALLIVTSACLVRCRHCMRKRMWGRGDGVDLGARVARWVRYLADHDEIAEVILSGGDPLALSDRELAAVFSGLAALDRPRRVRVHSRAPVVAPGRITARLAAILARGNVRRLVTQFNHPVEITPASTRALATLAAAGIAVSNQAVLLRGVNDRPDVLASLFARASAAGASPYYLHHPDLVRGAMHFHLPLPDGLNLFNAARALSPQSPAPKYVIDLPGKEGKREVSTINNSSAIGAVSFQPGA